MNESKGHVAEICADIASVLAYQAPTDDKILSGEMWEASGKLSGALVSSEKGLRTRGGELDWELGD